MNIGHTLRPGNSLQPLADMIDTHVMNDGGPADPMPRDVQNSPYVERANLCNLRAAINNVPHEVLHRALADMLAHRFGKTRASLVLRDAVEIVEGGK